MTSADRLSIDLARLTRASRRTGRSAADGRPCPDNPRHGRTFVMRSGHEVCVHHSHDAERLVRDEAIS